MENFIDSFLSLASPATIVGATIYITDKNKLSRAVNPVGNVSSWATILTWLAELGCLWTSYYMSTLLYEVSQKQEDDDVFSLNSVFLLIRAIFVSLVVLLNLSSGLSLSLAKSIQSMLCCGTFHDDKEKKKSYKGGMMKYLYFILEVVTVAVLPIIGFSGMNKRLSMYSGVCDGKVLDMQTLDASKELSMGTYYGWTIVFFGISLGIRLLRSLVVPFLHGNEKNNLVSYPSFTEAKSFVHLNNHLQAIEENHAMEQDIRKRSRVEVTYNLTNNISNGPERLDLHL